MGEQSRHVEMWRLRRRLECIEKLKPGPNTSVFTLLIRPDDQVTKIRSMINDELAKSSNIKSNQNRYSVQDGQRAIIEHLKSYRFFPKNGLACYYGSVVIDPTTEKEFRLKLFFQPPRTIPRFVYNCDTAFDISTLKSMLQDDTAIGFIIINGKGAMFATVRGNSKDINLKISVDLPRKHTRGGQSAARFARIREDARKTYISQVCEKAAEIFITDNLPNVANLVLAGQAQLKEELEKSSRLDHRLKLIVYLVLTVDYGGETGLNEAIRQSSLEIGNIRLGQEIKYITTFMDHLNKGNDNMVAYGIENVLEALQEGAVDTVIAFQDLALIRWEIDDPNNSVLYLPADEQPPNEQRHKVKGCGPLVDWLADYAVSFGSKLELVSDQSTEGTMLVQGFHGLVALLRYARIPIEDCDMESMDSIDYDILEGVY